MIAQAGKNENKRESLVYLGSLIAALFSGASARLGGTLFAGDLMVLFALLCACGSMAFAPKRRTPLPWLVLILFLSFPMFGLLFDLGNGIAIIDLIKGVARNLVFAAACVLPLLLIQIWTVRRILTLYSVFVFGFLFSYAVSGGLWEESVMRIAKYYEGTAIPLLLVIILMRWPKWQLLLGITFALLYYFILDFRGQALVWGATVVISAPAISKPRLVERNFLLLLLCACGFVVLVVYASTYFQTEFDARRELSNRLRSEMLVDAWEGYLARPIYGNGSWQHARNYIESGKIEKIVGVHSYIFQFAYEYGTYGLIFALLVLFLLLLFYRRCLKAYGAGLIEGGVMFVITYLAVNAAYTILNSPFAGVSRMRTGLAIGCVIAIGFLGRARGLRARDLGSLKSSPEVNEESPHSYCNSHVGR